MRRSAPTKANRIQSVGLGGDGDEIHAIQDVEIEFNAKLDYQDAPKWFTAGDVFASLQRALRPDQAKASDLWDRYAKVLTRQTGVDPVSIEPASPLLSPSSRWWSATADASAIVWIVSALLVGTMAAVVFLLG